MALRLGTLRVAPLLAARSWWSRSGWRCGNPTSGVLENQMKVQEKPSSPSTLEPQRYSKKIHPKTRHEEATKAREQATTGGDFTTIRNRGGNPVLHRFLTKNRPRQKKLW